MAFPQDLVDAKVECKVVFGYTIDKKGKVKDILIMKSSGNQNFDNAVVDLYKKMPRWNPATLNGKKISSDFFDWYDYIP